MEGVSIDMSIKKLTPEESLALNKFNVDEGHPHIIIDKAICATCDDKPCLVVCPAVLYRLKDNQMTFEYAGCLECGTCRVMCRKKGITSWDYPRATFGVFYRCG
jgi:ferredoxin like protein